MRRISIFSAAFALATVVLAPAAFAKADAAVAAKPLTGKVLEVKDVPNYTYLKLKTATGETWAAVPTSPVKVGSEVTVANPQTIHDFESKALNKKFDTVIFGTLGDENSKAPGVDPHGNKSAMPAIDFKTIKVEKAGGKNAYTIAEIYSNKAELKGKTVAVRGKVTKYLPGIMGKNWIHLSDGTGDESKKNFDLTVTTKATASKGDVVVVTGKLEADKNIGSGYFFPVVLEEAKVEK